MNIDLSIRYVRGLAIILLLVVIAVGGVGIQGAHADAPLCRYTTNPDTVIDKETGLTWERNPEDVLRTWDDAVSYCSNLNVDNGGWRLPTPAELQTLVDESRKDPAIDQTAFPGTASDYYWTKSPGISMPGYVWMVEFNLGLSYTIGKSEMHYARCVR